MPATASSPRLDSLLTGLFYLGLAVTGAAAFVAIRPELFADGEPARTLANLTEKERLARIGVALEMGTVTFQALAAVWFVRLFRHVDIVAAVALALFGMVNAIAILASSTLLRAALDSALAPSGADPTISHLFVQISGRFWESGAIFFGLWLMPMGWLVLKGKYGPRALGWILIVGGIGYIVPAFVGVLAPDAGVWVGVLPILAAVGEFWMIGLLFWKGLRGTATVGGTD